MRKLWFVAAGVLSTPALLFLPSPPVAVAAEASGLGVTPADGGDWIRRHVGAGETTEGVAVISNAGGTPLPVLVYAADATTTPQGGFALRGRDETQTGVGLWLLPAEARVVVPPRSSTRLAWRLTVPSSARAGQHAGGIVVQRDSSSGTARDLGSGVEVRVDLVERVGLRVYVTVPGTAAARLSAGPLRWERDADGIRFSLPVANVGATVLKPAGSVRVHGRRPSDVRVRFDGVDALLPGQSALLTVVWREPPALVWAEADAVVEADGTMVRSSIDLHLLPSMWWAVLVPGAALTLLAACRLWARIRRRSLGTAVEETFHDRPRSPRDAPVFLPKLDGGIAEASGQPVELFLPSRQGVAVRSLDEVPAVAGALAEPVGIGKRLFVCGIQGIDIAEGYEGGHGPL